MSFRISIKDGLDNEELARNLSTRINTPNSPEAGLLGFSVARTFNGTFPPVQWPPSTTVPQLGTVPPRASAVAPVVPGVAPLLTLTARPTAIQTALQALRVARENQASYTALTKRMSDATEAHADALVFGNQFGTTPAPTEPPMVAKASAKALIPHTLGRLIYDAFVNTPAPVVLTTPMPTPAVPTMGIVAQQGPQGAPLTVAR